MSVNRAFLYRVVGPFVFAIVVFVIFYATMHTHFPHSASGDEWMKFVDFVFADMTKMPWYTVVLLFFFLQTGHTVLSVQCVHITQMLFGYCFGVLYAGCVSALCECVIVSTFVMAYTVRNTFMDATFEAFVARIRAEQMLYPFIFMSQMSSVPISSTSSIIGFADVTAKEYLYIHYGVSVINAFKCAMIGHQIRVATQPYTVVCLGYVIALISVMPTLITLLLWYCAFVNYKSLSEHEYGPTTPTTPPKPHRGPVGPHSPTGARQGGPVGPHSPTGGPGRAPQPHSPTGVRQGPTAPQGPDRGAQ
jgi:hypothetical protein